MPYNGPRRGTGSATLRESAGGCHDTVKRELNPRLDNEAHSKTPSDAQGIEAAEAPLHAPANALRDPAGPRDASAPGIFPKRLDPSLIDRAFAAAGRPCLSLDDSWSARPFSIPMPPPNITGKLHLGHALDLGLQDALIRSASSRGASASWIAGCDHAGQATHDKIMAERPGLSWGTPDALAEYGRSASAYAERMREGIMAQFAALHPSSDLSAPRFTLDAGYQACAGKALDQLIAMGRISKQGSSLMLDLRPEARLFAEAIESGHIQIEPQAHAGRLLSMLREERLWDIGRSFPWGFQASLSFDGHGLALGRGAELWTMDTWLTSSLWPIAIQDGEPFDALIIGYDIAYFWGARMAMMSKALGKPWPFKKMMLHGLIRDSSGRKFSKSLGNGIDPLEIIFEQGSDALRLWCCSKSAWGADFKWNPAELSAGGRWLTKMANACRLLEMRMPSSGFGGPPPRPRWPDGFQTESNAFEAELLADIEAMRLDRACLSIQAFSKGPWCEGWLSSAAPSWGADPSSWIDAWRGQMRLLALAHPFAPASTWWLSERLSDLWRSNACR